VVFSEYLYVSGQLLVDLASNSGDSLIVEIVISLVFRLDEFTLSVGQIALLVVIYEGLRGLLRASSRRN
jgi:hypothetical protein